MCGHQSEIYGQTRRTSDAKRGALPLVTREINSRISAKPCGVPTLSKFRKLSWNDFDEAVAWLAAELSNIPTVGIYGQPRGGLPLAVALSHRLSIPFLLEMRQGAIWVDDIVDTGRTRDTVTGAAICAAWFSRRQRDDVLAAEICTGDEWLIFPWSPPEKAEDERLNYLARRSNSDGL